MGDTSFDQTSGTPFSSSPLSKRPNSKPLVVVDDPTATITQEYLKTTLETLFLKFENNIVSKFDNLNSRLDTFHHRLSSLEEDTSLRNTRVDNLIVRVEDLEGQNAAVRERLAALELGDPAEEWKPVGLPRTKVLLLGDSNSGGKIKFGTERGTLGGALPGSNVFCAKIEELPAADSQVFEGVSDIVLSVGTNNLKLATTEPDDLIKTTYTYVKEVTRVNPGAHVLLPAVLPVHSGFTDEAVNPKINFYNYYLKDMCDSLTKATFIDVNVFANQDGTLKQHLSNGASDPLHLSTQGIKLFASRLKYALRNRHDLPVMTNRRERPFGDREQAQGASGNTPSFRGSTPFRGNYRGNSRGNFRGRTPDSRTR